VYVCGLDGTLCVYEGGRMVWTHALEPCVRLLKAYPACIVAVGERRLFHHPIGQPQVLDEVLRLGAITAVLGETDCPVLVDAQGKGICVNQQLVTQYAFHTAAGAVPLSADRTGRHCVFLNPDGSRSLMIGGRVVFTHLGGTLAASPTAERFAVGEQHAVRVVDAPTLGELMAGVTRA